MSTLTKSHSFSVKDVTYIAMGAVLITLCAWITLPLPAVPVTMQLFAVFAVLLFLGGRRGFFSILTYLLLGAVGLPVFSGFTGGFGVLLNTTGGYLLGFILLGLVYWGAEGLGYRTGKEGAGAAKVRGLVQLSALVLGLLLCYALGTIWFYAVYTRTEGAISFGTILAWCVLPFVLPDLAKLLLAYGVTRALRRALGAGSASKH